MQRILAGLSMVAFDPIELTEANALLLQWQHKMGACNRPNACNWAHALHHEGNPVALTVTSSLIRESVGGGHGLELNRENTVELSRLCAERAGLCRVALRLWREFVFPALGYRYAISYQDADMHNGNTYRFDGWTRLPEISRSGSDTRSGRKGRNKWVWLWAPGISTDVKIAYELGLQTGRAQLAAVAADVSY